MGRFGIGDIDNYGNGNGGKFFSLKNNGDIARVRIMYNDAEDIEGFAVHEITVDEKSKYVSCLRKYNDPTEVCPFCAAGNGQKAKFYIPLYDIDTDEVKLWERGKKFMAKISGLCARYVTSDTPLVAHTFEIERHGAKGDTGTTYEIYETGSDDTRLEDLPEIPEVLGNIVLEKTADEMNAFLDDGAFPNSGVINRRNTRESEPVEDRPTGRRTPSTRRGDAF